MNGLSETHQYAALPWRSGGEGLEILLITSRQTRRWVIPKGWPIAGLAPAAAAAREAYEEAGIEGQVAERAFGWYHYLKHGKDGAVRLVRVDVFPLQVDRQHANWPESAERSLRWCTPGEASGLVQESALSDLLRQFAAWLPAGQQQMARRQKA